MFSRTTMAETLDLGKSRNLIDLTETTVKYLIQNKEYDKSPEEYLRATVYIELVEKYYYSPFRIDFKLPVSPGLPGNYADIVVFKDDNHREYYMVIEVTENGSDVNFQQAIEQGFSKANSFRAELLIVDRFNERIIFDVANFPANEREANQIVDIGKNYGLLPANRLVRGGPDDLKAVSFSELANLFRKCHSIIWSGGKLDPAIAFDEMSKILFAKIQDERSTPYGANYRFQIGQNENEVMVAKKCLALYDEARSLDPQVFTEEIRVSYSKIRSVVEIIQEISLSETDLDAKGQAFENFLGVVFRGELGQYFTRRQVVEFVVEFLEPTENDVVLDPSCGSGGFLLYCLKEATNAIRRNNAGREHLIQERIRNFAKNNVYGIEINSKIARVAMMDMIVNDGNKNIENNTGLNSRFSDPGICFGRFSLIMTNPPFGVNIKRDNRDNLGQNSFANFKFGGDRKSQLSDILFLEQYRKFLVDDDARNPRLGVVVQTGVLNNPSNKELLNWLKLNFQILGVVSLPDFAFRKAGSGMKTCLLFLKKYRTPYSSVAEVPDYPAFFAVAGHIGYDSTLRPDCNDFPKIIDHYRNRTEDRSGGVFWINFLDLDYRLDPTYYFNKFVIATHFDRLTAQGHVLVRLSDCLSQWNAGKSPEGGVTRSSGDIPSVTITNIAKNGILDFSENLNFVPADFYAEFNISRGGLKLYDILVAKDGATTGKTTIVDEDFAFLEQTEAGLEPKAIFSEHLFRLRVKSIFDPMYIHAFLNSDLGQLQLETVASGGAQGGITREFVHEVYIPLVSSAVQQQLAQRWKRGIRRINKLKKRYEQLLGEIKVELTAELENAKPLPKEEAANIIAHLK